MWDIFKLKKAGIFAGGVLFGTAGVKILASDDAKKVYTNCTAAVLRAKECVLKTAATIQENAEDVYAEAQQINEGRSMSHVQQKRLRLSTKQKKQKRQKLRKRIQVRRISKRKKFKSL